MSTKQKTLLRVLDGEAVSPPPIWLMRQAGRYLPEYRETRAKAGSFLDLCYTPELAEEVTLQPIRRFGFDASILFADILLIPHALGQPLRFVEGEGPRLDPISERTHLGTLRPLDEIDETLGPVYETVTRLSRSLPSETTLIGFAGAPWTVATYMIAGRGTPDQGPARRFMYQDPEGFAELIDLVTSATVHYLSKQIDAGAEVVMLFDSWAGALPADKFSEFAVKPAQTIVSELRQRHPSIPAIGFPRGAGLGYPDYGQATGVSGLAVDASVPMKTLNEMTGGKIALQGNLDPMLMVSGGTQLDTSVRELLRTMSGVPHVFNLGHGITPEADVANVERLINLVRGNA